jgi:hypothetical protein
MGSDKARVSYDPKQQYRSVVMQQGRVTLEADWNESGQITNEEIRREALDVVGPCGTPDNGYQVATGSNYDLSIGEGTMYVGGMRACLPNTISYSSQPDWLNYDSLSDPLDHSDDALYWVQPGAPAPVQLSGGQQGTGTSKAGSAPTNEFVYLYLREQEVSAVEDPNLAEIALGGPDTAARTRLVQHIVRVGSTGPDCASGMSAAEAQWASQGVTLDGTSMRLQSEDNLLVSFSDLGQSTPCQPQAQGGYLDPDNQLIRVQISGIDPLTGNPSFVWGFDNASFLYRISVTNATTMTLQSIPADTNHQPASGQAVEILRSAAELDNPGAYVAALSGFVVTLDKNYDQSSQSIQLPSGASFPSEYLISNQSPSAQLFLRVWQQQVVFTPGQPIALGDTGLLVTLQTGLSFHTGDYWQFAVRPSTPQSVYPQRYQNVPQPPEGPRMWASPLAVVSWNGDIGSVTSDCRPTFGPLASRALHIIGINWPNDDLVSLPAFRNNPLQVNFDFSPSAASVSDSTMIVTIEIPYIQAQGYRNVAFDQVSQAGKAVAPRASLVGNAQRAQLPSSALSGNKAVSVGTGAINSISTVKIPIRNFPTIFESLNLPDDLLSSYQPLINSAATPLAPSVPVGMVGYLGVIQPGNPSVASGTVSWTLQLSPEDLIQYLAGLSQTGLGGQVRVRVTLKGREIWNGLSNPLVYLDGQVFGQPSLRADGTTPCTDLILPSGSDARTSDFESWFWLSLFVWAQTDYSLGDLPLCMATGDFNGDGMQDIAVATLSGGVFILLNNGSGGFSVGSQISVGEWPLSIVAADFNGDGFLDLAVTSYTDGTVTVLLGSASGAFSALKPMTVGSGPDSGPWAIVAANFITNGAVGLAVSLARDNTVAILTNQGGGTFSSLAPFSVGNIPVGLVAVDLNGDNIIDLAVLNAGSNNVAVFIGTGQGAFTPATVPTLTLPSGSNAQGVAAPLNALPLSITTADFNNTGNADLAVGTIYEQDGVMSSSIVVFLNQGAASFDDSFPYSVSGIPASIVAVNLDPTNSNGSIDLVATGASFLGGTSTFSVLLGNGDGSFQTQVLYPINANPVAVVSADFNGDGIPDLAMGTEAGNVSVLLNEQGQISSGGAAVITSLTPSGSVQVGQLLTVSGRNFGFSTGSQQVSIDNVQVNAFMPGSNDQQLMFEVPSSITNVPAQGTPVTLSISNGVPPPAIATITLLPGATLGGSVGVNYVAPVTTGNITAGAPLVLRFTLDSGTNLDASWAIQPVITGPSNASAFNNNLQVLDSNQRVIASKTISLSAGQGTTFYISINPVPLGSSGEFTLTVNTSAGTVSGSSSPQPFTVGEAAPAPDPTITANFSTALVLPAGGGTVTATQIELAPGSQAKVTLLVVFTVAATYNITAVPTGSGWSATLFAQTTVTPLTVQPGNLTNASNSFPQYLDFIIAPGADASAAGQVQFQIQNSALTTSCTYNMNLVLGS